MTKVIKERYVDGIRVNLRETFDRMKEDDVILLYPNIFSISVIRATSTYMKSKTSKKFLVSHSKSTGNTLILRIH